MLTEENTFFLRAFLLLVEGGGYISTEILERERRNESTEFDDLLNIHKRKLNHEFRGKQQYKKIFPDSGNADIDTWDLSLKIGVMMKMFRGKLTLAEKQKLRTLRTLRNEIFVHCVSASLDDETYEEVQEQLEDAISTLASSFDQSVQDCCTKYIRQCTVAPIDYLKPSIATLNGLSQGCVREVKVYLDIELRVLCPSKDLADHLCTVLDNILKMAHSGRNEETDLKDIAENVHKLREYLQLHKDVELKGSKKACIKLTFECRSYAGMLYLLHQLESGEYRFHLNEIADALMSHYQPGFPVTISSEITTECLQSALIDIIKTVLVEEEESNMYTEVTSDDIPEHSYEDGKQLKLGREDENCEIVESTQALKLALECQSKEGLFHILKLFHEGTLSDPLESIAAVLFKFYKRKITLKATLNHEEVMTALEDAVTRKYENEESQDSGKMHGQEQKDVFKFPFDVEKQSLSTSMNPYFVYGESGASVVNKINRKTMTQFSREKKPYSLQESPDTARKRLMTKAQAEQKRSVKVGNLQMGRRIPSTPILSDYEEESVDRKILRRRVSFIKWYASIKDQLSKSAAVSIAEHLISDDQNRILDMKSTERRKCVELLLKAVVLGPDEMLEDFISELGENEDGKVFVKKIENEQVTDIAINDYFQIESGNQEVTARRLKFSINDYKTLKSQLNNRELIDKINDHLFSRCRFSIDQHTEVSDTSVDSKKKTKCLLDNLQLCGEYVFKDFTEILISLGWRSLVKNLDKMTQKRKRMSESESETEHEIKRMRYLDRQLEYNVVKLNRSRNSDVRSRVRKYVDFEIEHVNKGSIVIYMKPIGPKSWITMEDSCRTGKIKDFIPELFDHEELYDQLPEGQVILQLSIYSELIEETKRAIFVLHDSEEQVFTEKSKHFVNAQCDPIEDCICEHLDTAHRTELLKDLNEKKLVDDRFMEEIKNLDMRTEKTKHLVQKIYSLGPTGIDTLKNFLKDRDEYLYQKLCVAETLAGDRMGAISTGSGDRQSRGRTNQSARREIFFSCKVILQIKKNERLTRAHGRRIEITCPEISDRTFHFEKKADSESSLETTQAITVGKSDLASNESAEGEDVSELSQVWKYQESRSIQGEHGDIFHEKETQTAQEKRKASLDRGSPQKRMLASRNKCVKKDVKKYY